MTARSFFRLLTATVLLSGSYFCQAQQVQILTSGTKTSLRGLSVVNDQVLWVSGSNGHVGRSTDGGQTWQWTIVPGFEKRDFRDIEAFDSSTAVIIAIAEPAHILKTVDGGRNWKIVFTDSTKGMFLDAMDFYDAKKGIVVGDPIDGKVFFATTADGGNTWKRVSSPALPVQEGEAFFAASGTNIRYHKDGSFTLVSGGKAARLFHTRQPQALDIIQGSEMTGPNSIAIHGKTAVIMAGDYDHQQDTTRNSLVSTDGMKTWQAPVIRPNGYRSCVAFIGGNSFVACGVPGVDISRDGGLRWQQISSEGFHVCQAAKKGSSVFFAGGNGRIGKLKL